ncbi:hypothetical protein [Chryseobacterium lathyri]|nr:hypothetical protein [Chryseobacterium lathyri]
MGRLLKINRNWLEAFISNFNNFVLPASRFPTLTIYYISDVKKTTDLCTESISIFR